MSLLLTLLLGCAEYELAAESFDDAPTGGRGLQEQYTLRVDVYPGASEGVASLPQSFFDVSFDSSYGYNAALALQAPVRLTGQLSGFDANPNAIGVPGQDSLVTGFVEAFVPGTPMDRVVATDEEGGFDLELVPASGYTLAVIPELPAELPFLVLEDQTVDANIDLSTYLDYGLPVYGQITVAQNTPLNQGVARLLHTETGVTGPSVPVDEGFFMLRAYPGSYTLQIFDPADRYLPVLEKSVIVSGESVTGVQIDFDLPGLSQVVTTGEVKDPEGRAYEGVEVRFTSLSLRGLPEGSHSSTVTSNESGLFIARLPPGTYQMDFVPPFGDDISSTQISEAVLETNQELGVQTLEPLILVQSQITHEGQGVGATLVRAQEIDGGGRVFQTTAADDGYFSLPVSAGALEWTFTPPTGSAAATTIDTRQASEMVERDRIPLDDGVLLQGQVTFEGEALPFSVVDIRDAQDTLWAQTVTDANGAFLVRVSTEVAGDLD